mmetsp:Transcript_17546/g.66338  ORF Transcript_17546/g.66338 Transcript_17546/m.66338 type:complete len:321 (+) Transcript_17546:282-1244(+)
MTMFTRSMSMPRPKRLVVTRMRLSFFLKAVYWLTRSFWGMRPWMAMEGKLLSTSSLLSSSQRATEDTKMMTWLKSRLSRRLVSLRFFFSAGSSTKYCCRPCRVSLPSSTRISCGSWRNLWQMGLILSSMVAEYIITCFWGGVFMKTFMTWRRMSTASSILSHSSRTKNLTAETSSTPSSIMSMTRPGVPTTMCGGVALRSSMWFWRGTPPKSTADLTAGRNLAKRWYSSPIWKAISRVWQSTITETCLSLGWSWFRVDSTNTAVLPMPERAWQSTSMPERAWGMAWFCTSEGCSKPASAMARRTSGLRMKSLNSAACTPA